MRASYHEKSWLWRRSSCQKKGAFSSAPKYPDDRNEWRLAGLRLRLLGALLLDFFDLFEQVVGLLLETGALVVGFDHVGLAAIEKIQVGHGVVVVRAKLNGFLNLGNTFVNQGTGLRDIVGANGSGKRVIVLDLLVDVVFVVGGPEFGVAAERD